MRVTSPRSGRQSLLRNRLASKEFLISCSVGFPEYTLSPATRTWCCRSTAHPGLADSPWAMRCGPLLRGWEVAISLIALLPVTIKPSNDVEDLRHVVARSYLNPVRLIRHAYQH